MAHQRTEFERQMMLDAMIKQQKHQEGEVLCAQEMGEEEFRRMILERVMALENRVADLQRSDNLHHGLY